MTQEKKNTRPADTDAVHESADVVSEIAGKRRADLQRVLKKPVPDFVLSIFQSEVGYTIAPQMLPYSQMDFAVFRKKLEDLYNLHLKEQERRPVLTLEKADQGIDAAKIQEMLKGTHASQRIEFVEGRFPISRDDFVSIKGINLTSELVHVAVRGSSTVGDVIVKEIVEALWASTGAPKKWDSLQRDIQMVKYGTATKVDLGFPLEAFLAPSFNGFMQQQMVEGKRYAAHMVSHSARDAFAPPPKTGISCTLDDVKVLFHVFNQQNGRSETVKFRFSVMSKDEQGTGIFVAISEMPFDTHVECLSDLKSAMEANKAK